MEFVSQGVVVVFAEVEIVDGVDNHIFYYVFVGGRSVLFGVHEV